jgi:hypothetical protein
MHNGNERDLRSQSIARFQDNQSIVRLLSVCLSVARSQTGDHLSTADNMSHALGWMLASFHDRRRELNQMRIPPQHTGKCRVRSAIIVEVGGITALKADARIVEGKSSGTQSGPPGMMMIMSPTGMSLQ